MDALKRDLRYDCNRGDLLKSKLIAGKNPVCIFQERDWGCLLVICQSRENGPDTIHLEGDLSSALALLFVISHMSSGRFYSCCKHGFSSVNIDGSLQP